MLRAFTDHPDSVGETYAEHMDTAWSFAASLAVAALCCFLHGLLPFAFQTSASRRVNELHRRMVTHRRRDAAPPGVFGWAEGI
jgi:hypothetical protein